MNALEDTREEYIHTRLREEPHTLVSNLLALVRELEKGEAGSQDSANELVSLIVLSLKALVTPIFDPDSTAIEARTVRDSNKLVRAILGNASKFGITPSDAQIILGLQAKLVKNLEEPRHTIFSFEGDQMRTQAIGFLELLGIRQRDIENLGP